MGPRWAEDEDAVVAGIRETTDALQLFGRIDIYLFDQLQRGNIRPGMRVLDAGCGSGRNLDYLARAGFAIRAVDADKDAVDATRRRLAGLGLAADDGDVRRADITDLPWPDGRFDVVLCSAVLHFLDGHESFRHAIDELWRVLDRGGILWTRLASTIGIEGRVEARGDGRYVLPDGTERFCVTERDLLDETARVRGALVDPIKTTNVQGMRCMTTWVLRKT